jgi:hypothetical protein
MKFRTEIIVPPSKDPISYRSVITMLGSCFTGQIGSLLRERLFDVTINPFGVIYNPSSILRAIENLMDKTEYTAADLLRHNELWFSFDHYTKFSDPDPRVVLENINREFLRARETFSATDQLVLTFGTSFVYEYQETGRIVSNCHKIPSGKFNRYMLTVDRVADEWSALLERLLSARKQLQVIFTVSPVRHLKDGMEENQRSKAVLHLAIRELLQRFPDHCVYFPSYEIMMDDLRDYRFYAKDLVHPGDQATQYIWEKFSEAFIDEKSLAIGKEIESLLKAVTHRPLHGFTQAHDDHTARTREKIRKLQETYSFLQWQNFPDFI